MKKIALIHAMAHSIAPVHAAFDVLWPQARLMNLLDDSLSADVLNTGLDQTMHTRFLKLADYVVNAGANALLFTCSAFGPCIDTVARHYANLPVLKPNEAMIQQACARHNKTGLLASFAPTLLYMPAEFPPDMPLDTELAHGALEALHAGEAARHDELVCAAAGRLLTRGCEVIALAQFSLARAAPLIRARYQIPVLTTVDSAVHALRQRLEHTTHDNR